MAVLIYFLVALPNHKLSGEAVLNIETSYLKGEPLEGVLELSLKEGELIPASSEVIFENSGQTYEFPLNEIIKDSPVEGDYYVENTLIEGSGEGYGNEGKITVYPEVNFVLQIYNQVAEGETTEGSTEEENTSAPITGGFLSFLFGPTGMVSMELKEEIEGTVSKDKPFVYELGEGEEVELKPKSLTVNGEEVSDNLISLDMEGNVLTITTDYSENEKGYGEEFLGDKEKKISLDLSDLNLVLEEGDLDVRLVYEDNEILHLNTVLEEGEEVSGEIVEEEPENETENETEEEIPEEEVVEIPEETNLTNETILENETVEEIIDSSIWDMGNFLTDEERAVLIENFGNTQLKTVKSELFKGRIIVGYDFGGYSVEYSYDSSLDQDTLNVQMERDRIKFLKDIANIFLEEEESPTPLGGFNETYAP